MNRENVVVVATKGWAKKMKHTFEQLTEFLKMFSILSYLIEKKVRCDWILNDSRWKMFRHLSWNFSRFAIVIIDDVYFSISAAIKPIELFDKIHQFRWI